MQLFRIAKTAFADQIDGEGARRIGGRWNRVGDAVLYMAEDLSLAVLETIVHANPGRRIDSSLLVLNLPDDASVETLSDLPKDWDVYPYIDQTSKIGSQWITEQRSLLLRVPSAVTSGVDPDLWCYNVLVNPNHPEFRNVKTDRIVAWKLDKRLV